MKQTLYVTQGLPGSGKSTRARQMVDASKGQLKRVNMDTLRSLFDNHDHSKSFKSGNEKFVKAMRDELMEQALVAGYSVINDDTNLSASNITHFQAMAKKYKVEFELIDLTDTPLHVCIKQDLRRMESVGKDVIMKMAHRFYVEKAPKPVFIPDVPDAIIVDIDGTLAHMDGKRSPYDFKSCDLDDPDDAVIKMVNAFKATGQTVIVMSGREGDLEIQMKTEAWLKKYGVQYDALYMRAAGDCRCDTEVKLELFEKHVKYRYNIVCVLDDRGKVVHMWRKQGLKVLDCSDGWDFDLAR